MFTLRLSSYSGSPGESWFHINVVINWQLSKQGIRWPVSPDRIAGSGVDPSRSSIFLKLSADKLLVFKWSQAQVCFLKIYMKYVVFMSLWPSTIKILTSNLPRTRKFSQLFKNTGWEDLFLPWYKMKYSCYQESSVIHGWFVYRLFGWEMRHLSKSEIRFRMASFSFFTLLDTEEEFKSLKRFRPYLIAFRSCISNGKPE